MAAFTRGARLPAWPYLMDIMNTHCLNVIVGPSVFEAPLYTAWCTSAEDFEWGSDQQPLILLDWIQVYAVFTSRQGTKRWNIRGGRAALDH
eukprot:1070863-Rhodomonas_salina.2